LEVRGGGKEKDEGERLISEAETRIKRARGV
jgi:hypothetical protein